MDTAEPLYREALERGGLAPNEVLEGYVRLGAIRSALGKKDQAVAAFRAASILDANFAVPSEAGPKGPVYAAQARRDTAKIGSLKLHLEAPREAPPGKAFKVSVRVDAAHVPIITKIALLAKDGTSGREAILEAKTEESVDFDVPAEVALPNASILVRLDALDAHQNRLGTVEERVRVPADGGPPAVGGAGAVASGSGPTKPSTPLPPGGDAGAPRSGGGFWSSPWPYVIGGVALAGAGVAVYLGTRPSEGVTVGQVGVRTR